MKPIFRVVAALILFGTVAMIGLAVWRVATRPKAIEWPNQVIRSKITKDMPRSTVLKLLGPPHNRDNRIDHYFYINSYGSRESRHASQTPSTFSIFFKDDKVESILSAYDY